MIKKIPWAIGWLIHIFIPAGRRFAKIVIDPDVGHEYGFLISLSLSLSVAAITTVVLSVLFWYSVPTLLLLLFPLMMWGCGWAVYKNVLNTYG